MEFTGNRLEMLEMCKKAMKLANDNSPIEALKGIYIECDEDAGEVSMITTNYEASIFMKANVSVASSGKLVINAKILMGILTCLSGEQVGFSTADNNIVQISSESSVYGISYLSGAHYPKPVMPFPEDVVKLSCICDLVGKTVFAVSKSTNKPILQCVNLKVKQNSAHLTACDSDRMMLVKGEAKSDGAKEFLLPVHSFKVLASISTNEDEYDVGAVGKDAVFTKRNMLFSIRQQSGTYINTNQIIQAIKPKYTAVSNARQIYEALDLLSVGAGNKPVNIIFFDSDICFKCNGEISLSSSQVRANITGSMPKQGFFYNLNHLLKLFQVLCGTIKFEIDEKGMMLVKAKNEIYFQLPVNAPVKKVKKTAKKAVA